MNIKKISVITLAAALAAGILRFVDFKFFFDSGVGFFTDGGVTSWIALAIILLTTLLIGVGISSNKSFYSRVKFERGIPEGIAYLVSAIVSGCGVKLLYDDWSLFRGNEVLTSIGVSMRLPFFIVSGVLTLFFVLACAAKITGVNIFARAKLVYLISVIWSVVLILYVFIHYSISVLKTENIFIIIASCVTAIAFFLQARFFSDVNKDGKALRVGIPFTSASAMLMLSYSLSDLAISYIDVLRKNPVAVGLDMLMLAVGTYMILVLAGLDYEPVGNPDRGSKRKAKHFKK